ncbi:xylulokinase [Paenibacillus koleovorans]|uniref:xylulokinase n=1 Tax=Paenibacillus koleovorans TaxID=121608 RepID=UPI0013E3C099|nr:FGGY family carbohydrate kinase [Paenibacillus koleovorans]
MLTLDIGTSSCKAVIFDTLGRELLAASGRYGIHYSDEDHVRVEQSPEEIWTGVVQAIQGLRLDSAMCSRLKGISISSQISSHFLVDHHDQPLTRLISWMDRRASREAAELAEAFSPTEMQSMLGATLPAGASWPIPKLRWLRRHHPEVLEQARYLVQPKEWVLFQLTGQWMSDVSSLRGWGHQLERAPATPLIEWAGADAQLVPPMGEPWQTAGLLSRHTAALVGLPAGLPVILGWNDLNAAVLGLYGGQPDLGIHITGTSDHIGLLRKPASAEEASAVPAGINAIPFYDELQLLYGVSSAGGYALQWFMDRFESDCGEPDYEAIMKMASQVPAGSKSLWFLPYLQGERSPWWNPDARAVFYGLSASHDRSHMARAVLEGVGFALRTITDLIDKRPAAIRVAGGASRNALWNQIKADQWGVRLETMETREAGCLGAAILAAVGAGQYDSISEAATAMTRVGASFEPDKGEHARYEKQYEHFVRLYHALEPMFAETSRA